MRLQARGVALGDGLLPATDLDARSSADAPGAPVAVPVETDERPQLLSLVLGGRLKPAAGAVLVDGRADAARLRRSLAVVDTPFTSEPGPGIRLATVVAEELAFAGRRSGRGAVRAALAEHGLAGAERRTVGTLPAADRIRLLVELALRRPGVEGLVLTSPERHGGDPRDWFPALQEVAARGVLVLVVTDLPTATLLGELGAAGPLDAADDADDPDDADDADIPTPAAELVDAPAPPDALRQAQGTTTPVSEEDAE